MKPRWKAYEYSYRIHWSPGEHGYVASVAEFPTMQSTPATTPHAALDALLATVEQRLNQLDINGDPRPPVLGLSGLAS
ncbi:hypothetical protein ORI20_11075 [Mycobacterium sp. CVI_P3]|uniref:HicB family protein n=1 Tax=Mycobacterium pinniadriaticum TaxID=2994102 RepID=A0ABT3SCK6_9MYCO|nr:hypothetical protein [Mycobacterium pinniadriaticum]MCX2930823.1 hypothetical protein [Mycobacterium pinniadriaticum]MCX2937247.1 hypothetical protein [Mycobacterium pinniadriaticum]